MTDCVTSENGEDCFSIYDDAIHYCAVCWRRSLQDAIEPRTYISSFSKTKAKTVTYRQFKKHGSILDCYLKDLVNDPEIHMIVIKKTVK